MDIANPAYCGGYFKFLLDCGVKHINIHDPLVLDHQNNMGTYFHKDESEERVDKNMKNIHTKKIMPRLKRGQK